MLPSDVARCDGADRTLFDRLRCADCQRREAPRGDQVWMMAAPEGDAEFCVWRIGADDEIKEGQR